jgi:hypothetical protein
MTEPFYSGRIYEPARQLYLFFQVVIIIPTDGQTTVRFFFQVIIMNRQNIQARGTSPTIPTDGQTTEPFFPDVIMHLPNDRFFFGL